MPQFYNNVTNYKRKEGMCCDERGVLHTTDEILERNIKN